MATFIWFCVAAVVVFLDQLSKYLTVLYLKPVGTFPILQDALHLTYVENRGAAFGMLANNRWVFMIVSSVAIAALSVYLIWKKPRSRLLCLSLAFVIGGGIGNMIDRVALGYVVDMIDFRLIHFAVFNVADSFVCIGAGMLMLYLILSMRREVLAERAAALQEAGQTPAQESDGDPVPDESKDAPAADPDTGNPTGTPPDGGAPTA
jgi:signal peptidase II